METEARSFWSNFKSSLLNSKSEDGFLKTWLESVVSTQIEKKEEGYVLTIQTPSEFHKKWMQENLTEDLKTSLNSFYKKPCRVYFEIASLLPSQVKTIQPAATSFVSPKATCFNPEYTFENFIVGASNELSHNASLTLAEGKPAFNPLFIYGPSGLGKTHLLNAIGHEALKKNPSLKIKYLSAERFLNECVQSIQKREMNFFRKKYRTNCDILLVDDIQMIAKGEAVQEEFFHTLNDLLSQGARIVLCCDKPPHCIPKLEERIKTRLEGGLLADIFYPDLETRLAIVKHKLKKKDLFLSEESSYKVAEVCKNSIREIEGVLNKIKMMSELHGGGLTTARLAHILKNIAQPELTVEQIQKIVSQSFNLSVEDLKSPTRKKNIVRARQTAMYFIRSYLKKSLSDVGFLFHKKDHTTVINSIKKVEKLQRENPEFRLVFKNINSVIHNYNKN
ncbi:MAG: chromosomal replication initiator protein DnaA [Bdellovibrionales bacterium]